LDSLTFRILRATLAGLLGAVKALFVFALVLALGIPISRAALEWYARGRFDIVPPAVAATRSEPQLRIDDATPEEDIE
jgi:hypothetical protein